jgi:hypothetical protein
VPRIINPIVLCIKQIPELMKDTNIRKYIEDTFGGQEDLIKGKRARSSLLILTQRVGQKSTPSTPSDRWQVVGWARRLRGGWVVGPASTGLPGLCFFAS